MRKADTSPITSFTTLWVSLLPFKEMGFGVQVCSGKIVYGVKHLHNLKVYIVTHCSLKGILPKILKVYYIVGLIF